jgi:hypothetical protein
VVLDAGASIQAASFCMMPSPAPMLLVGALLEFLEVHF